jgi:hypothetical protein
MKFSPSGAAVPNPNFARPMSVLSGPGGLSSPKQSAVSPLPLAGLTQASKTTPVHGPGSLVFGPGGAGGAALAGAVGAGGAGGAGEAGAEGSPAAGGASPLSPRHHPLGARPLASPARSGPGGGVPAGAAGAGAQATSPRGGGQPQAGAIEEQKISSIEGELCWHITPNGKVFAGGTGIFSSTIFLFKAWRSFLGSHS